MLERLPHYGVFDFIAFGVNRGTVTLVGYSSAYRAGSKSSIGFPSGSSTWICWPPGPVSI
jgi:hypothetical protein